MRILAIAATVVLIALSGAAIVGAFAVLARLVLGDGRLGLLEPGFDLVAGTRSFAARHLTEQLEPAAVRQTVTDEVTTLLPMLRQLPRRVERIASAAEHGRLSVQVRLFADERDRRHVTGLLHQVLLTILAATAGIMAVLLLGTGGGPRVTTAVSLYQLFGYNLLVICSILALRVLVLIFRPDRGAERNGIVGDWRVCKSAHRVMSRHPPSRSPGDTPRE
jgi:ubiquinone biosynthesis protein